MHGSHRRAGLSAVLGATLLLLAAGSAAATVQLVAQPEVSAAADQYATLTFALRGEGRYGFEVVAPEGWMAVTRDGEVDLRGEGFVVVTVRVPALAPAGERFTTELRLHEGERTVVTGTGQVTVARRVKVGLLGPEELSGSLGEPLTFEVVVRNDGNGRDTFVLSAPNSHWDVRIDRPERTLDPGEQVVVAVTLRPTTSVNSGYRHILRLVARSTADPEVEAIDYVTSRFFTGGHALSAGAADRPRLTLNVSAGAAAGVNLFAGEVTTSAEYWLRPGVSGQLSDFVDGALRTNELAGSLDDPFAQLPSSLALSLEGPSWDGSLDVGPTRYAVGFGVDLERWRVSGSGSVTPGRGVGAAARFERHDRSLQAAVRTASLAERRTDELVANYRLDLATDLALTVGAGVSGFAQSGERSDYQLALTLSQQLAWQDDRFSVTQSYAGVPFAGVHTIGVTGGTRRLAPFGVRAQTAFSTSPISQRWTSGVTLFASPVAGLSMDGNLGLVVDTTGASRNVTWTVSPRLAYAVRASGGMTAGFSVRYGHGGVLVGTGTTWNRYDAGARLGYGGLGLSATAAYEVRSSAGAARPDASLRVSLQPEYALGNDTLLLARYGYEDLTTPFPRVRHEVGLGWLQSWGPRVVSRLEYERTYDLAGSTDLERIGLAVSIADVLTPGLHLSGGYAVASRTSLLDGATPRTHDLRVGVGYALPVVFDTPDALIDLFGGRRGGEVYGIAFVDRNQDGVMDASDQPLTGLEVRIGSERTTTSADGSYRLRVPAGTHRLAFPSGLPATMDLYGDRTIHVVENERHERPLPFAPVVSVTVELFDDRDNDGLRGVDEPGIAFGGVVFEGPERRLVRTNASGTAIVGGLLAGTYDVSVSTDHLPSGFRPTGERLRLTLEPGERPATVHLGAARPPRTVVRTFSTGTLAVLPRALQSSVAPGAELDLEALVQGDAERVVAAYLDTEAPLVRDGSTWRTRIRLPRETPIGLLVFEVRAESAEGVIERPLFVNVVDRPLFTASGVVAAVGKDALVEAVTHFRATEAWVTMPDGDAVALASNDGYRWSATWRAPAEAGRFVATLHADDEALGQMSFSVFAPPDPARDAGSQATTPASTGSEDAAHDDVDPHELDAATRP